MKQITSDKLSVRGLGHFSRYAACGLVAILLTGCTTSQTNVSLVAPTELPHPTRTPYSDTIGCFGDMLSDYRAGVYGERIPLRIAIVDVSDATNVSTVQYPNSEIPNNFTDIALGAAARIGGPIRVVHVPKELEIVDAARFSSVSDSDSFLSGFEPTHYRADTIQIYGALTAYDRFEKGRERDLDGSFVVGGGDGETNIELSQEKVKNQARMTMDFRAAHVFVGDVVNHSSSTNSLTLYQRSLDNSFGISVDGNSIGYSLANTLVDARHYAIRILVERGLVETIGKYLGVPYWRCFPEFGLRTAVRFDDVVDISAYDEFSLNQSVVTPVGPDDAGDDSWNLKPQHQYYKPTTKFGQEDTLASESSGEVSEEGYAYDPRDHDLIWSVVSDFRYAEYLENNSRKRLVRPDNTLQFELDAPARASDLRRHSEREKERIELATTIVSSNEAISQVPAAQPFPTRTVTVTGRHDKLNALVRFYQSQISSYQALSETQVLEDVTQKFVEYGVLNDRTATSSLHVYLALWLNLPVQQGARWVH